MNVMVLDAKQVNEADEGGVLTFLLMHEIRQIAKPIMEGYFSDLDIDEENISQYPRAPFILFIRDMGTHIFPLCPPWLYPCEGEKVRLYFAQADRHRILRSTEDGLRYVKDHTNVKLVFFFTGDYLWSSDDFEQAEEIFSFYAYQIRYYWNYERNRLHKPIPYEEVMKTFKLTLTQHMQKIMLDNEDKKATCG